MKLTLTLDFDYHMYYTVEYNHMYADISFLYNFFDVKALLYIW